MQVEASSIGVFIAFPGTTYVTRTSMDWKGAILCRLRERDGHGGGVREMVENYSRLWKQWEFLQQDCSRLEYERNHLQKELMSARESGVTSSAPGGTEGGSKVELSLATSKVASLEKKLKERDDQYMAQSQELTELLKKGAALNAEIAKLKEEVSKRDQQLLEGEARYNKLSFQFDSIKMGLHDTEEELKKQKSTSQTLKDELNVLQQTFDSQEERFKKTQAENEQLLSQTLRYKSEVAESLNKQLTMERDIKELRTRLSEVLAVGSKEPCGTAPPSGGSSRSSLFGKMKGAFDRARGSPDTPTAVQRSGSLEGSMDGEPVIIDRIAALPQKAVEAIEAHSAGVHALSFSHGGTYMATGSVDSLVKVWQAEQFSVGARHLCTLRGCMMGVNSVQFDPADRFLLAASNDKAVRIWSIQDQRPRVVLMGHENSVRAATYLPEGQRVISGSHDRTLKLWDVSANGKCIHTFLVGSSCNDLVAGVGMGATIVSGHFDKRVRLWDLRTKSPTEVALDGKITSLSLGKSGHQLLCCCQDNTLRIVDLRQQCVMTTLSADGFVVPNEVFRAALSPDNNYAAAGSDSGSIFVWDLLTLQKHCVKFDSEVVTVCAWHPKGHYFVSSGHNKKAVHWTE